MILKIRKYVGSNGRIKLFFRHPTWVFDPFYDRFREVDSLSVYGAMYVIGPVMFDHDGLNIGCQRILYVASSDALSANCEVLNVDSEGRLRYTLSKYLAPSSAVWTLKGVMKIINDNYRSEHDVLYKGYAK